MTDSTNPIEMLREIEAYLSLRLGPLPQEEYKTVQRDIAHVLHHNGVKGYEYAKDKRRAEPEKC